MGLLAPGSAHTRPSAQPPIDMRKTFPAHVSAPAESPSNISPSPTKVISEVPESMITFEDPIQNFRSSIYTLVCWKTFTANLFC